MNAAYRENFKQRVCVPNLKDIVFLDDAKFPLDALTTVADVCNISEPSSRAHKMFRVSAIAPVIDAEGWHRMVEFTLCDVIGIPVAILKWKYGNNWEFSLTNSRTIKERGSDKTRILTTKGSYVVKAIKSNLTTLRKQMPTLADLTHQIGKASEVIISKINGTHYVQNSVSLDVRTVVEMMKALRSGAELATLQPGIQADLQSAFTAADRSLTMRNEIESKFMDNLLSREFYVIAELFNSKRVLVTKVKVDPAFSTKTAFNAAEPKNRFVQTCGVFSYRDRNELYATPMGKDIEFQAVMMQQTLQGLGYSMSSPSQALTVIPTAVADYYFEGANVCVKAMKNENFLFGALTMMEVA